MISEKEELLKELKQIIVERMNLQIDPQSIADDEFIFGAGLFLDSIDALELVVLLDKKYGIRITNPDIARKVFYNFTTLTNYVHENRKK